MRREKLPMLKIESEYDEGDLEQVRTRIEAFIEMIKARREMLT
jgi:benzoyl-CoA reductase/2-hydroxyglutaryl-CoA dehydratase subunit BcrC/BadD/HgdB